MGLTLHAMLEGVLHEDEELLQLRVVICHCLAQTHGRVYQAFDGDFEHVEQIGAFHHTVGECLKSYGLRGGSRPLYFRAG